MQVLGRVLDVGAVRMKINASAENEIEAPEQNKN
jgi:hypothetical protein